MIYAYLANAHVFLCFGVVVDLGLFDLAKLLAHVLEEVLVDVVVEIGERHLIRRRQTNIVLIKLKKTQAGYNRATDNV